MLWQDLREEQFEEAIKRSKGLCVIPLGCLEKHGQHEPVGTDYYRAFLFAKEAAEIEDAVVFPMGPWLGDVAGSHSNTNPGFGRKRGFIGINIKTQLRIFEELCDEIARNGFNKIILFHSHGGNISILDTFLKNQAKKNKPYATFQAWANNNAANQPTPFLETVLSRRDEFSFVTDEDIEVMRQWEKTGYQGGHGNFIETAEILGHRPDLIEPARYDQENGLNNHRSDYLTDLGINVKGGWSARYPNSYSGAAPFGCSETIGKAMIKISIERAVRVYKTIKNDDLSLEAAKLY